MKWIGLTGGIASGKSTVARLIESRGYPIIDADQVSHTVTQIQNEGYNQILAHFGPTILDERLNINRKRLGDLVFTSEMHRSQLEGILHPLIRSRVQEMKSEHEKNNPAFLFYDVPLLFEKKMESQFDATLVVWVDPVTQVKRLAERNNLNDIEALQRIEAQLPFASKLKAATFCIDNSGNEYELILAVDVFLKNLVSF